MKKLIPLFVVLAAGIASAEWKLNPYTQRQDYYEGTAALNLSTAALKTQIDAVAVSTGVLTNGLSAEIARATARENALGVSTGTIKTTLDSVILSTAPLKDYANWNTAYGWGDHAGKYLVAPASFSYLSDANAFLVAPATFTYQAPGNYITTLTGNVTASGPGAAVATIVSVPATAVDLSTVTTALAGKLDTGGNAVTATALAADPTDCTGVNFARGVNASGTAACAQPSDVTGNAATATKLATARTINGVSFDGSADINISATSYLADGVSLALTGATFSAKSSSVTLQGNTFNGASQLVKLGADGKLPAVDGSQLTNFPSTPGGAVLASTQTFTGENTFAGKVALSNNSTYNGQTMVFITTGTYTGDGTNNRAIAHGLGTIPKYVHVLQISMGDTFCDLTGGAPTIIQSQYSGVTRTDTVTSMDTTRFYVTRASIGACNFSGSTYSWVAFR